LPNTEWHATSSRICPFFNVNGFCITTNCFLSHDEEPYTQPYFRITGSTLLNPTNFEAQDGPEFDVFDKDAGTHKDHVTIEPSHYQDLEVSYDEELDNSV
jgi:hypothetical protein